MPDISSALREVRMSSITGVLQPSGPDAPLRQEHPLIDIDYTVGIQLFLFLVVAFMCSKLLFRPYLRMRDERTAGIEGARDEAGRLSAEADARLTRYQSQLETARARAQDERRKMRIEAAERQRQVTDRARTEAGGALDEAKARIRQETDVARGKLMPQAQQLAGDIAETLLGRKVGA
jgi:F-type H+-transporting ATPase subunit b